MKQDVLQHLGILAFFYLVEVNIISFVLRVQINYFNQQTFSNWKQANVNLKLSEVILEMQSCEQ